MKITRVEAIPLRLPEINERCDGSQETLVVKVHTDAGITGVGEVDSSSLVAKAIIDAPLSHKICRGLAECVVGQDPFEIDRLIHRMYEGSIFFGRQGAAIQAMTASANDPNPFCHPVKQSAGPGLPALLYQGVGPRAFSTTGAIS